MLHNFHVLKCLSIENHVVWTLSRHRSNGVIYSNVEKPFIL